MTAPAPVRSIDALERAGARAARRLDPIRDRLPWSVWVWSVLAVVTVLSRLPGLLFTGMFDRDESFLAVMGDVLRHHGTMYVDVIDRKPPIVPMIYGFVRDWSVDMRAIRALLAVLILLDGVVVTAIVRRLTRSRRAALFGGVLSIVGTALFLPADAQAANFELWGLLPASFAIYAVIRTRSTSTSAGVTWWFTAAGAAVMVAANCKQPYVVVGVPVMVEVWRHGGARLRNAAGAAAGAVAVFAAFAARFDADLMWRWVWADNGDYLSGGISMTRASLIGLGLTVVFCLFHLPFLHGVWAGATRRVRIDPVLASWAIVSAIVVPIGFRFFGHYYQQLVPPLAVLTAVSVVGASRRVWLSLSALTVALAVVLTSLAYVHRPDLSNFTALGRYVQRHTGPGDRILVWGALPDVYVAAERGPSGVFLHDGYLTGNWASRAEPLPAGAMEAAPFDERWAMFFADVAVDPPVLVIDAARPGTDWAAYGPGEYPIGEWLRKCYERDVVIDGLPVWRRDTEACPTFG